MRKAVIVLVAVVATLGVTVLFVLPVRTLLAQSHSLAATQHHLKVLDAENAKLAGDAASLRTDARIEQLAREKYGLVKPGERAYVVLPRVAPGG